MVIVAINVQEPLCTFDGVPIKNAVAGEPAPLSGWPSLLLADVFLANLGNSTSSDPVDAQKIYAVGLEIQKARMNGGVVNLDSGEIETLEKTLKANPTGYRDLIMGQVWQRIAEARNGGG